MKKLGILLSLLLAFQSPVFAASQWTRTLPGSYNPSDLDTFVTDNNTALDRLLVDYRKNVTVTPDSSTQVKIQAGEISIPNSDLSVVRMRRNTSVLTLTAASNMDTGSSFSNSTQYYVYATADTDIEGFLGVISASSSAPSGFTYYRRIGYFYVNASGNITNVGNIAGGDVTNIVTTTGTTDISSSASTLTDIADTEVRFVSSGRPILVRFSANIRQNQVAGTWQFAFILNGSQIYTWRYYNDNHNEHTYSQPIVHGIYVHQGLAAGAHTLKVQWVQAGGMTLYQDGATWPRITEIIEL